MHHACRHERGGSLRGFAILDPGSGPFQREAITNMGVYPWS